MKLLTGLLLLFVLASWPTAVNAWPSAPDRRDYQQDIGDVPTSMQKQISAIDALLPISSGPEFKKVKIPLIATNGCYKW